MHRIVVNDYVNSTLTAGFLFVVVVMVVYGVLACRKAYANNRPTVREYPESHQLTAADEAADALRAHAILAEPGEPHLHLYGKSEAREGRKMGHVTRLIF